MTDAPGWATLADDESVIWLGRPVIYHFLDGLLGGFLLVAIAAVVGFFWPADLVVAGVVSGVVVAAVIAGLGVLTALWTLVDRWRITYLVTTQQVYVKRGLLSRTVKNLRVEQIQNASFTESLLGRLFSYGDVHIDTAGSEGPEVVLRNVANPDEVLGHISQRTERG